MSDYQHRYVVQDGEVTLERVPSPKRVWKETKRTQLQSSAYGRRKNYDDYVKQMYGKPRNSASPVRVNRTPSPTKKGEEPSSVERRFGYDKNMKEQSIEKDRNREEDGPPDANYVRRLAEQRPRQKSL